MSENSMPIKKNFYSCYNKLLGCRAKKVSIIKFRHINGSDNGLTDISLRKLK